MFCKARQRVTMAERAITNYDALCAPRGITHDRAGNMRDIHYFGRDSNNRIVNNVFLCAIFGILFYCILLTLEHIIVLNK